MQNMLRKKIIPKTLEKWIRDGLGLYLGGVWDDLGPLEGALWALLGCSWASFGRSWGQDELQEAFWMDFGLLWEGFGTVLGRFGNQFGRIWGCMLGFAGLC